MWPGNEARVKYTAMSFLHIRVGFQVKSIIILLCHDNTTYTTQ